MEHSLGVPSKDAVLELLALHFPAFTDRDDSLCRIEPRLAHAQLQWALGGIAYGPPPPRIADDLPPETEVHEFFLRFQEPYETYSTISPDDDVIGYGLSSNTFDYLVCVVDAQHVGFLLIGDED